MVRTRTAADADVMAAFGAVYDVRASERRRAVRVPYESPLSVEPCGEDGVLREQVTLHLQDFSAVGIGALSVRPIEKGGTFVMRLRRDAEKVGVVCTVAHCRPTSDGRFRIGAQFTRVLAATGRSANQLSWVNERAFAPMAAAA